MRKLPIAAGLLSAAAFFACKPRQEGGSQVLTNASNPNEMAVDVNDLSYLLPRDRTGKVYPEIRTGESWGQLRLANRLKPFDQGGDNLILTKAVYDSIVAATADQANFGSSTKSIRTPFKAGDTAEFEHDSFVITSFRIDPCAPSLALDKNRTNYQNPLSQSVIGAIVDQINQEIAGIFGASKFTLSACQTQLRLILQPMAADGQTLLDSTIHMVYTLNGGVGVMNDTLQADVQGLKKKLQDVTGVDTTGYLLQPHPGLNTEAHGSASAQQPGPGAQAVVDYLSSVLSRFNNPQVMAVIRERVVEGVQYDVVLGGGVSDPRQTGTYAAGPLVGSSAKKGFIITSGGNRRSWRIDPQPTRNAPVFDNLITWAPQDLESPQDSNLVNMMKKDDPESTHFFVNDCVTCHGTSQAFREIADPALAAASGPRYRVPPGVSGFPIGSLLPVAPQAEGKVVGVQLRNFGYSLNQPIVGLRTVTETAALADYFNRDLRRINNPGASCVGDAEQKAWIAAISIGKNGSAPYAFTKGAGAREDQLFDAAGCAKAVTGTAAIGTRGDGQNTPKVGTQQSPIFSQMSFEGSGVSASGASGPMTLTLAKMGQAVVSQAQAGGSPELAIGSWEYAADPNNRVSQIQVTMDGVGHTFAMNGATLCEVPVANVKALTGCLVLQSNWAKGIKPPTVTPQPQQPTQPVPTQPQRDMVYFYANNACSGESVGSVVADTDCANFPKDRTVRSFSVNHSACKQFANPVTDFVDGSRQACTRVIAATRGGSYRTLYYSDRCETNLAVAVVDRKTNCAAFATQTLNQVWGAQDANGNCRNTTDLPFDEACAETVKQLQ